MMIDLFIRLVVAAALGGLLGLERTVAGKVAGLRTYALVSLGSALFISVSELVVARSGGPAVIDTLRVASHVVLGIVFLGAGLIVFRESRVSGLTTAAGLWVAAGIGMTTGFGFYLLAIFAALLTLVVFTVLWLIEKKIKPKPPAS